MKNIHNEAKDFRCNKCAKTFGQKSNLHKHTKNVHYMAMMS